MDNGGTLSLSVSTEEDGCAEDPLEGSDNTTILRAPCCIANVSSICAALSKVILGLFCRIASVARKREPTDPAARADRSSDAR
jgi:hypothetical protein